MLKLQRQSKLQQPAQAAAFRRLCVETRIFWPVMNCPKQPPSGGCVLKLFQTADKFMKGMQPPSGGCVLKLLNWI